MVGGMQRGAPLEQRIALNEAINEFGGASCVFSQQLSDMRLERTSPPRNLSRKGASLRCITSSTISTTITVDRHE